MTKRQKGQRGEEKEVEPLKFELENRRDRIVRLSHPTRRL